MNYAFGLWEKRCGSYFDTDWFNLNRVKSDSDHPNPTGQIITLHIPFTQEQTDTLTEGQPGPFYTKGVYSISFRKWFRNRKKCYSLTCANTMKMLHCCGPQLENVLTTKSWNMWDSTTLSLFVHNVTVLYIPKLLEIDVMQCKLQCLS